MIPTLSPHLLGADMLCPDFFACVPAVLPCCAAMNPAMAGQVWPGVAGVFQVAFILGSGLMFFVSRSPAEGSYGGYEVF